MSLNENIRYNTLADKRNEISTAITRKILESIDKSKDIEISYSHTQLVFKGKKNHPIRKDKFNIRLSRSNSIFGI